MRSRTGTGVLTVLVVLLVALLLGGCAKQPTTSAPGGEPAKPVELSGEPYVIGAIFAITGDASSLGIPERNTAEMLQKMINGNGGIGGRPLEIKIEDTKGEPAETLTAAKRLVEGENVLAVVGPSRTGTTLAIVDYMGKSEVPLISCAAGIQIVEPARKWVFKTPQSDRLAVEKIIEYLKAKNMTKVASLSDNTGFGKSGRAEIEKLMPAAGIKVVTYEEYGPKDTTVETQLTKIKGTDAQAVVCWGTPPGPAIVAKNMKQLAITIPLVCSHGVANATFLNIAGDAANGVVLPAGRLLVRDQIPADNPQAPVLNEYAEKYQAEFGKSADTFGGHAWDAIQLAAQALREVGPDRAAIRDYIEQKQDFVGTGGVFNFSPEDHNGLTKDAFVMVEVSDGKWKLAE
ncbi:MAG TPA: ABC transporter substrate-binding protein [Armatimonadota bacterium]|nr:ABC transporter substrate-binding protein [Armatimonadota bacterium]